MVPRRNLSRLAVKYRRGKWAARGEKRKEEKKKKKKKKGYFVERVPSLHGDVSSENNVTR